jgi:hypothetical protein
MFLRARIQKNKGMKFEALSQQFKVKMAEELGRRIGKMKAESADIRELRVKRKIYDIFKFKISDRTAIKSLLLEWKSKALFSPRQLSVRLTPQHLKTVSPLDGLLKLWIKRTVDKQWSVIADNALNNEDGLFWYYFTQKQLQMYIMLSTEDEFQFEMESGNVVTKS